MNMILKAVCVSLLIRWKILSMLHPSLNGIYNFSAMFNHTRTVCFFLTEQQFSPDLFIPVGQKRQIINRNITAFVSNTVNFKKQKFSSGNIKCRKIWHPHTNIDIIHLIIWYLHAYTPMHTHRHMIQYAKLGSSKSLSKCLYGEVMLLSKHLLQYESNSVCKFTPLFKHEDLKMSYIIKVFHHMPSSVVLFLAIVSYF